MPTRDELAFTLLGEECDPDASQESLIYRAVAALLAERSGIPSDPAEDVH